MAVTTKKGVPITASRTNMGKEPNVLTDQSQTSRDLQRRIPRPPEPFSNPQGAEQLPAGSVRPSSWGVSYDRTSQGSGKPQSYGEKVGCANTSLSAEEMAAIGYSPNATKSDNPIISGRPTKDNVRRVGPGSFPVARGRR